MTFRLVLGYPALKPDLFVSSFASQGNKSIKAK